MKRHITKRMKRALELSVLVAGAVLCLATSGKRVSVEYHRYDERWIVSNLYDGQTGVPKDHVIELAIGYQDFFTQNSGAKTADILVEEAIVRAKRAFQSIYLIDVNGMHVNYQLSIGQDTTYITHDPFSDDTQYQLDLSDVRTYTARPEIEPITFTTTSAPKVTGVWRTATTVIVTFSEPMDPESLYLSQSSVDLLWEADNDLHSMAADLNLADFTWQTDDDLFMFGPVDAEWFQSGWLVVSGEAQSKAGALLDGNADGVPGDVDDDYVTPVSLSHLPICYAREDIPMPCIAVNDVPHLDADDWESGSSW